MEIYELNNFSGTPSSADYLATDNGEDTRKISAEQLFAPLNARIDNIIGGGDAPSAAEVTDARLGASELGSIQYASLGAAIRGQVGELYNDAKVLYGDKNALDIIAKDYGYIMPLFSRKAWDFTNRVQVNSRQVVCSDYIPYTNGDYITINVSNGVYFRVAFFNGDTYLANGGWKTSSHRFSNSLGATRLTVEYKYSDSRVIPSLGEIVNNTSIFFEKYVKTYVEESDVSNIAYPIKSLISGQGFAVVPFDYGGYDFTNQQWVNSSTVLYNLMDYSLGDSLQFINSDPTSFRYRVTFFANDTNVGSTGFITDSRQMRNTIAGVNKVSLEIGYLNNARITDKNEVISNFAIKTAPSARIIDEITTFGIFEKWATIGDSFSIGRWYVRNGDSWIPYKTSRLAWGAILSREVGNTFLSLGIGGINTRTFLTAPVSTGGGMALAEASPEQELYFLCLGINDTSLGSSYIGTVADIPATYDATHPDTFYGNYGEIIRRLKHHSPDCRFIISKLAAWNDSSVKDAYNAAIEGLAEHFEIPCIDPFTDDFFSSNFYLNTRGGNNGHPTGMTYGGMAMAYKRLISKCIYENPDYFVTYNGTADGNE